MTENEARRIAELARQVDGGCSVCVGILTDHLAESFPQWPWHEWNDVEYPANRYRFGYKPEYEPVTP